MQIGTLYVLKVIVSIINIVEIVKIVAKFKIELVIIPSCFLCVIRVIH
jgi:hypothetical protein